MKGKMMKPDEMSKMMGGKMSKKGKKAGMPKKKGKK